MMFTVLAASVLASTAHVRQDVAPELDELQPSPGLFSCFRLPEPYELAVGEALLDDRSNRECQLLTIPSFASEWAVYLTRERSEGPAQVVFKRMREHLYPRMEEEIAARRASNGYYCVTESQREALKQIRLDVDTFTAPLGSETTEILDQIWSEMLGRVRYPETMRSGCDGENYYFAHWDWKGGPRSGHVWSPEDGTRTRALVEIAEKLAELAQAPPASRAALEKTLLAQARSLSDRLEREPAVAREK